MLWQTRGIEGGVVNHDSLILTQDKIFYNPKLKHVCKKSQESSTIQKYCFGTKLFAIKQHYHVNPGRFCVKGTYI